MQYIFNLQSSFTYDNFGRRTLRTLQDIKSIFNMPSREEAEYMLKKTVEKYAPRASEFAKWIEKRDPGRIDGVQSCARLYRGTAQAENNKYGRISK